MESIRTDSSGEENDFAAMFKIGTIIVSVTRKRIAIRESCERESFRFIVTRLLLR